VRFGGDTVSGRLCFRAIAGVTGGFVACIERGTIPVDGYGAVTRVAIELLAVDRQR
jgi:hypothetical protein